MKLNSRHKGILLILLSAFFFACGNACTRLAGDVPTIQKSFFRNAVAMLIAAAILLREGRGVRPASRANWPQLIARAVFGTIGLFCNFYAVDHLLLSDASMLNKMSPFFAVIASAFLLREMLAPMQIVSLTGAFVGALFIVKPTLSNMDLGASLIGFAGGVAAGIAYTFVRLLGQRGERSSFIVFFFSAFSCAVSVPYMVLYGSSMTTEQTLCLVGTGCFAALGQFCITGAYRCAPAREISIFDYSQVIIAAILGRLLFGDVPDGYSFLGYIIICVMALLNFWYNNRRVSA